MIHNWGQFVVYTRQTISSRSFFFFGHLSLVNKMFEILMLFTDLAFFLNFFFFCKRKQNEHLLNWKSEVWTLCGLWMLQIQIRFRILLRIIEDECLVLMPRDCRGELLHLSAFARLYSLTVLILLARYVTRGKSPLYSTKLPRIVLMHFLQFLGETCYDNRNFLIFKISFKSKNT